jgi:glyoxalase family protein
MKLEGIHHVTCITGDAPQNVRFYAGTLGLRMVKKSVNQDDPTVYHLFYADEQGTPGSDITFFEYPGANRGRAGAGMIHRITWRVASEDSIDFWEQRLSSHDVATERSDGSLRFEDPEGLGLELAVIATGDEPLRAKHQQIPEEHALAGFDSVRAYAENPDASRGLFESGLGFAPEPSRPSWLVRGDERGSLYIFDEAPSEHGVSGAGTVHHVAWASQMDDIGAWRDRTIAGGAKPTPIIDRFWFRSVYFREPSGVLFEIATLGPGFAVDEAPEELGEKLVLPPDYEHLREKLEKVLTPLPDPRSV